MNTAAQQIPDTAPGPYYISVRRDDGDTRLVSGPYVKHDVALALVDMARRVCERLDCKAVWYAFGTVRMVDRFDQPGILQKLGYGLALNQVPS